MGVFLLFKCREVNKNNLQQLEFVTRVAAMLSEFPGKVFHLNFTSWNPKNPAADDN